MLRIKIQQESSPKTFFVLRGSQWNSTEKHQIYLSIPGLWCFLISACQSGCSWWKTAGGGRCSHHHSVYLTNNQWTCLMISLPLLQQFQRPGNIRVRRWYIRRLNLVTGLILQRKFWSEQVLRQSRCSSACVLWSGHLHQPFNKWGGSDHTSMASRDKSTTTPLHLVGFLISQLVCTKNII